MFFLAKTRRSKRTNKRAPDLHMTNYEINLNSKGNVVKKLGNVVFVSALDDKAQKLVACTTRGRLKLGDTGERSLVCVGDNVLFCRSDSDENAGVVEEILERRTLLTRTWALNAEMTDPLVANADVLVIVVSVKPPVKPGIIDRYLVAGFAGGLESIVVLNKVDLNDYMRENAKLDVYRSIDVPVIETSALTGEGVPHLASLIEGRISTFCGHSGVGKSSLINTLFGLKRKVGEIVAKTLKGKHTTTASEMLINPSGGFVIDTPGIRGFGVCGVHSDDLISYFPEIADAATKCSFTDCRHTTRQTGCAVLPAIASGKITESRWESYLKLKDELAKIEVY